MSRSAVSFQAMTRLLALVLALTGCSTSNVPVEGRPCTADEDCGPGTVCDRGSRTCVAWRPDAAGPGESGVVDADVLLADLEAGAADASPPDGGDLCQGIVVDGDTVAFYDFSAISGGTIQDLSNNNHPGQVKGGASLTSGAAGCGQALQVDQADQGGGYVEIADSPAWDLSEGAVELLVRFDPQVAGKSKHRGILGRDANMTWTEGHFQLFRACDGSIVARIQRGGASYTRCSQPVADETWLHLGVNFGPQTGLQLFVNHQLASRSGTVPFGNVATNSGSCSLTLTCGGSTTGGIDGNNNPWVVGAADDNTQDGSASGVVNHLGGRIDQLRISGKPRDFAGP